MKRCLLISFFPFAVCATPWQELLKQHRTTIGEHTYQLLMYQYQTFATGQAPSIADERVKQIAIVECHEPIIDLRAINHQRISVMQEPELLKAHASKEDIDPRSAQHSCMRQNVFHALVRMLAELDALAPAFGYQAGELEIRLFEGLRDLATQKQLFDTCMASILQSNPTMTNEQAYTETTKWYSPYINNVPVHSTGAAVDIHLWSNKTETFCDMGNFNTNRGGLAPTFSEGLSEQQRKNRLLFVSAATRAGLTNYLYEFWHFSYGDRYATYWREHQPELRVAIYGSV